MSIAGSYMYTEHHCYNMSLFMWKAAVKFSRYLRLNPDYQVGGMVPGKFCKNLYSILVKLLNINYLYFGIN